MMHMSGSLDNSGITTSLWIWEIEGCIDGLLSWNMVHWVSIRRMGLDVGYILNRNTQNLAIGINKLSVLLGLVEIDIGLVAHFIKSLKAW